MNHSNRLVARRFLYLAPWLLALCVALPLTMGVLPAQQAAAQIPTVPYIGYGQTIPGEVTSSQGTEHLFTGCANEVVSISVTADNFSPRVKLYAPPVSANAPRNGNTVVLEDVTLPDAGLYTLHVSGRSRNDRGGYSVTLIGDGPNNPLPDDGNSKIDFVFDGETAAQEDGTFVDADDANIWRFRGCEGDKVRVQVVGDGFAPQVELLFPIAELPIASAELDEDGVTARFEHTLPANGVYQLAVSVDDRVEAGNRGMDGGDYALTVSLQGRPSVPLVRPTLAPTTDATIQPTPTAIATATSAPTVTPTATPTVTPIVTATSGPRVRRGTPIPRTPTPVTTQAPTQTPVPQPTATATVPAVSLEIFCTVITERLNLRPGPGTNYTPPIDVLEIGEILVVVGRNADASWLQVAVLDSNLDVENIGWVSADFLFCVGEVESAPVIEGE